MDTAPAAVKERDFSKLTLTADCCAAMEQIPLWACVHVQLTNDEKIRVVNREQQGVDQATDITVLSYGFLRIRPYRAQLPARHSGVNTIQN